MYKRLTRPLTIALLAAILASCSNQPRQSTQLHVPGEMSQAQLERRVGELVQQAREASVSQRTGYLLEAAELLLGEDEPEWAFNLLNSIEADRLGDYTYLRYIQAYSEAALASGYYFDARDALFEKRLEALWGSLALDRQTRLLEQRARLDSLLGDYQQSLSARIRLGGLLASNDELQMNNEAIWQDLMSLPADELQRLARQNEQSELEGWAQLALISRNNAANLSQQLDRVEAWRRNWPGHPASVELPSDLQLLRQLIDQQPRTVALLLPQTGRLAGAASAVRDGFLAAYYAQAEAEFKPTIIQYDSSDSDINALYDQAVAEGAQMIVGPLAKEHVEALAERPSLAVPVLALNYREADASNQTSALLATPLPMQGKQISPQIPVPGMITNQPSVSAQLYQFGLAPEDEARQIARHAHLQGYRRAMIIAPDIDWAERSVEAFVDEWSSLDGLVVADSRYIGAGDYSDVIKNALLLDASEQRHKALRQIIYTNSEFEPRRRQDVEVIFLIANPRQARQIKPTLAFHYAGDIPVLATSQIYDGEENGKGDRDLNGIRFNTLPWFFSADAEARAIDTHTEAPATYRRLHAMGADAYHLYPRLPQLQKLPHTRVLGATGSLTLNREGRVEREPIWAEFDDGIARPVSSRSIERARPGS